MISDRALEAFQDGDEVTLLLDLGWPLWHPSPLDPDGDPIIPPPVGFDLEGAAVEARRIRVALESVA